MMMMVVGAEMNGDDLTADENVTMFKDEDPKMKQAMEDDGQDRSTK